MNLVFSRSGWWLGLVTVVFMQCRQNLSAFSITPGNTGVTVTLGWTPSPSTNVIGYFLNWGLASGQCTNQLDVGNATNATVGGLATNVVYYFNIVAYDAAGDQAPPSNELAYHPPPPTLSLQLQRNGTNAPAVCLSFQGSTGKNYLIQATVDFKQWVTIGMTNCTTSGLIAYMVGDSASYPKRFYRLAQQPYVPPPPTVSLQPSNGTTPATLRISFQGTAGTGYVVQATQDFQQWVTVWTTNCVTSGLVVYATTDPAIYPNRFYRIVQQ